MSLYLGCVLFSLPVLLIYMLGAVKHLSNPEANTCDMTYMFERPQYVRIQLQQEIEQRFPRYGLYAYGEGFTLEKIRATRFNGIPVLFIPGNAGSHQQVRSLASVSLRKSLKDRTLFHFDFFTVDLHEEYSALLGGIIMEQTEFVSHCIQRILKFYSGKIDSVILIGHSMGGIVSKGILLEPVMKISQVNTIIMLATPHRTAFVLDTSMATMYQRLQESEKLFNQSGVVTISVGGGPRDVLVNSNQIIDRFADLNVLTTHVPGVWKSTDHLCILWCKEFVLAVIRALFDSVDTTSIYPSISSNKEHRLRVFNYHFLQRTAGKKMAQYQAKVEFEPGGEWIEDIRRQYKWKWVDQIGLDKKLTYYLMVRLIGQEDRLTIETINLDTRDWLFACSAAAIQDHSRVCEWGWNLTNKSRIFPDATQRKKTVDLDLEDLKARRLSHVVIRLPSSQLKKGLFIGVDLHKKSDRVKELKNKFSLNHWGFGKIGTMESTNGTIRYEMNLNNIDSVLLKLTNVNCNRHNYHHSAAVELLETWTNGISQVRLFTYQDMTPKLLKVQTRNETNGDEKVEITAKLKFTFDPECVYTIEIWHSGFVETVASVVRDRWPNLYSVIVGLLLLALAKQVDHEKGLVNSNVTTVVTLSLCLGAGIGLECFVALAVVHVFGTLVCCAVVFFGSTAFNIAQRFLAQALKFSVNWSGWVLGGLNQVPLLAATILLSMVPVTCGALSMFLFIVLQFLKLLNLYEDYLEQLLLASLRFSFMEKFRKKRETQTSAEQETSESNISGSQIGFHLVLFLVWCAAGIPAIPSVLEWAKNYRYSMRLTTEDPYLTFCWVIIVGCGSAGITWIPSTPTPEYYFQEIATVLRLLAWVLLMVTGIGYPGQYQYLVPSFIAVSIGLLAIHPLIRCRNKLH